MKAKIELRQPRGFGEIIGDSILFIKQNWEPLLKCYFTFCGFFVAANITLTMLLQFRMVAMYKSDFAAQQFGSASLEYFLNLLAFFFNGVSMVLTTVSYVTLYNLKGNSAPTVAEVWSYFKYYFLRVAGSSFLWGIIFFISMVMYTMFNLMATPVLGNIGTVIAVLFLFVLIAYFGVRLSLFFAIMIAENAGFGYSTSQSFRLTSSRWWRTFGVLFIITVLIFTAIYMVILPFGVLSGGSAFFMPYNASTILLVLYCILICLIQIISLLPWTAVSIAYYSYTEENDNVGLLERISNFGKANESDLSLSSLANDEY